MRIFKDEVKLFQKQEERISSPCRGCLEVLCATDTKNDRRGQKKMGPAPRKSLAMLRAPQGLPQPQGFLHHLPCPHSSSGCGTALQRGSPSQAGQR